MAGATLGQHGVRRRKYIYVKIWKGMIWKLIVKGITQRQEVSNTRKKT